MRAVTCLATVLALVSATGISGIVLPAHAFYNNLGRDGEKGGAITKADLAILKKALTRALDKDPDGRRSIWKNTATGASGTIQPVRTLTWKGYRCRIVNATVTAKAFNTPSRYRSRMCFVPGRGWLISE
jgi:surface antigen